MLVDKGPGPFGDSDRLVRTHLLAWGLAHRFRSGGAALSHLRFIVPASFEERPSIASPLPRARTAPPRGPGFGPGTPSRDFDSPSGLGSKTVRGRRLQLGFRTDDRTRTDSILFLTCWLRAVRDLRACEKSVRRHLSGGDRDNHQLVEPHKA